MSIDPALQQALDAAPMLRISQLSPVQMRAARRERLAAMTIPVPDLPRIEDRTFAGPAGEVPVRIYWPAEDPQDLPLVVFFHGGGWVVGDLDSHDPVAREIAAQAGAIVVAVDYRLAPEHPYPAAVEDAEAALRWVAGHAAELGGDVDRLAVAGDSAGGNLAAIVAQQARDTGAPAVRFQLLWYPATGFDHDLPSERENAEAPILSALDMLRFIQHYVGEAQAAIPGPAQPVGLAPANADDLAGLPPAFIATAGYDPLHDDGAAYADLLRAAGVPVEHRDDADLVHGYLTFAPFVPAAATARDAAIAALKAGL